MSPKRNPYPLLIRLPAEQAEALKTLKRTLEKGPGKPDDARA